MNLRIENSIIWHGRQYGPTWFHPRATALPGGQVLMTCQNVTGNDNFGQTHWSVTDDGGVTWTKPHPIAAFERKRLPDGYEEGVCDVVPEYHEPSKTVLAMGHNVFYRNDILADREGLLSVYSVGDGKGNWSERRELEWDDPRTTGSKMCGCAQRATLENGDVLVPLYFGPKGREDRSVTTVRYSFDGEKMSFLEAGRELRLTVGRGLLEPSIVKFENTFWLTIRAEDGRGYLSQASDGLHWSDIMPWRFDDGGILEMSTTQQRWIHHGDLLYLVYTRKREENQDIIRWRAPLLIAQIDTTNKQILRATEQIVFPIRGDARDDTGIALTDNFHTTRVSPTESWITVGENMPYNNWRGDTLLARIY